MNRPPSPLILTRHLVILLAVAGGLALVACGSSSPDLLSGSNAESDVIQPEKELLITDLSVVNDPRTNYANPDNPWSFGTLMANMSADGNASSFVLSLLKLWEEDELVNGFNVTARPAIRQLVINPWLIASGCAAGNDNCNLDFSKAPVRLLAIVSRLDLRRSGNAGQGRFVFNVLDSSGKPSLFTIILEYALRANNPAEVAAWAHRWHALGKLDFGKSFNDVLEGITRDFAGRNADPRGVNGSALLQLRTNEIALTATTPSPLWQMREFGLSPSTGRLSQRTVAQTPDLSFNNSQPLANFILGNASAMRAGTDQVSPYMLAGAADVPGHPPNKTTPPDLVWGAPGVPSDLMLMFATATCNGCHLSATGTRFLMIKPRLPDQVAALANVLQGQFLTARVADLQKLLDSHGADPGSKQSASH